MDKWPCNAYMTRRVSTPIQTTPPSRQIPWRTGLPSVQRTALKPKLSRTQASGRSRSARSASSMAISAQARSMRCANRCSPRVGRMPRPAKPPFFGILSLIIWALILVVTVKYVLILLRADNNGEGGTLALMALANRTLGGRSAPIIVMLGMISAALFYGDVHDHAGAFRALRRGRTGGRSANARTLCRSAFGLDSVCPVPSAVAWHGASRAFFGPITLVWFIALAIAGGLGMSCPIPSVLAAFNPIHGLSFLVQPRVCRPAHARRRVPRGDRLGSPLCRSRPFRQGADPHRMALRWPCLRSPSTIFGQGALLLGNPAAIENPFFLLYPEWALIPMVGLATAATVIASQAVITGAYSITHQAVQLGLLPRLEIRHTSEAQFGQIYIPRVNLLLLTRRAAARRAVQVFGRAGLGLRHRRHRH